jgi:DNA-binding NtrC family response regulator
MADRFRVLVIDDDPGVRDYMEALVTRQGYEVHAAADGEEALAQLRDVRPDLVTLDVVLPGMDGLATLAELKKRLPEVPVVMLSGHGQARNIVEAMRLGASDFLRKPFEVEELELAFQKALEKRALTQEVERLRERARSETELLLLCGDNLRMRELREVIEQVADTDITVLVRGESGTGKELVARTLFQLSGEGGVHRGPEAQARQVRVREQRDHLPGRDQRDAPQPAGEAAPGAPGRRVLASGGRERREGGHAHHRRHQPQPGGGGGGR